MTRRPQNKANVKIGGTGERHVAKNATPVVEVVRSMAPAASGNTISAISSVVFDGWASRPFFHLSTATNRSSAPRAEETKRPIKLMIGKLL